MSEREGKLAQRIRDELVELERVVARVTEGWRRALGATDDYYLDSVALNLHGFYSGIERIFEIIAQTVDRRKPAGENWHQTLLVQMTSELPTVRPAVISAGTAKALDAYRGFRHVVRNVYAYNFDAAKIQRLVDDLPQLFPQIATELDAFARFLDFSETRSQDDF